MTPQEFLALPKVANDAVKVGDRLVTDDGFTCVADGTLVTVESDGRGELYFTCAKRDHYLDGQFGEDGYLVGLRRAPEVA